MQNEQKNEQKDEEKDIKEEEEMDKDLNKLYSDVKTLTEEMAPIIEEDKKLNEDLKQNALIMLNGIEKCCEIEDIKILNALIVGFEMISKKIKSVKFIYNELKVCLVNYYSSI